jgi:hypothetical protein
MLINWLINNQFFDLLIDWVQIGKTRIRPNRTRENPDRNQIGFDLILRGKNSDQFVSFCSVLLRLMLTQFADDFEILSENFLLTSKAYSDSFMIQNNLSVDHKLVFIVRNEFRKSYAHRLFWTFDKFSRFVFA